MSSLSEALNSHDVLLMVWTAAALGAFHTVLGPDHYVPFVMMARAEKWSRLRPAVVTFLCGVGHVRGSIAIGAALVAAGAAVSGWESTSWAAFHEWRGPVAAWLLVGVGAAFFVYGIVRARRGIAHTHVHVHGSDGAHEHEHAHEDAHLHPHTKEDKPGLHPHAEEKKRSLTPWVLFSIFIFGPCESLIPLMLAAWAVGGLAGTVCVAAAFSFTTILTMLLVVGALLAGISRVPLGRMDRYSLAVAGLSLVICGGAILFLGL